MWSSSNTQGGGGFMNGSLASPGSMTTPGGSSGGAGKKRSQNIVPVQISEIINSREDNFQVEGIDVGMVIIVGKVINVETTATKTTLVVEDDSGSIEVVQWIDEDAKQKEVWDEGTQVRVIGNVRSQGDSNKKHVMAFKVKGCPTQAEFDAHLLEIVHSHLKIKLLQNKLDAAAGTGGGLSNSMMGGGFSQGGSVTQPQGSVTNQTFGNVKQDLVYSFIRRSMDDAGIHKDHLYDQVRSKMSKSEMEKCLDFLSTEGHIYSTVDEDHFKSTDGE